MIIVDFGETECYLFYLCNSPPDWSQYCIQYEGINIKSDEFCLWSDWGDEYYFITGVTVAGEFLKFWHKSF